MFRNLSAQLNFEMNGRVTDLSVVYGSTIATQIVKQGANFDNKFAIFFFEMIIKLTT